MKRIVDQKTDYIITEISIEQNGRVIDRKYSVEYKDTPKTDVCLTIEEAFETVRKHFKKEDKKMKKVFFILRLLLLSACAEVPVEIVTLPEFDQEFAEKQIGKGKNTITGSAFLKQVDGRIQKCS